MYTAKDVMKTDLITVTQSTEIPKAISILAENNITGMPVVDDNFKLVGLISEKDVLAIAYRIIEGAPEALSSHKEVGDIMTTDVVSFSPDDHLVDVCRCIMKNPFRRVPVTKNGKLVGIISRKDIISHSFIKIAMETTSA